MPERLSVPHQVTSKLGKKVYCGSGLTAATGGSESMRVETVGLQAPIAGIVGCLHLEFDEGVVGRPAAEGERVESASGCAS